MPGAPLSIPPAMCWLICTQVTTIYYVAKKNTVEDNPFEKQEKNVLYAFIYNHRCQFSWAKIYRFPCKSQAIRHNLV